MVRLASSEMQPAQPPDTRPDQQQLLVFFTHQAMLFARLSTPTSVHDLARWLSHPLKNTSVTVTTVDSYLCVSQIYSGFLLTNHSETPVNYFSSNTYNISRLIPVAQRRSF